MMPYSKSGALRAPFISKLIRSELLFSFAAEILRPLFVALRVAPPPLSLHRLLVHLFEFFFPGQGCIDIRPLLSPKSLWLNRLERGQLEQIGLTSRLPLSAAAYSQELAITDWARVIRCFITFKRGAKGWHRKSLRQAPGNSTSPPRSKTPGMTFAASSAPRRIFHGSACASSMGNVGFPPRLMRRAATCVQPGTVFCKEKNLGASCRNRSTMER